MAPFGLQHVAPVASYADRTTNSLPVECREPNCIEQTSPCILRREPLHFGALQYQPMHFLRLVRFSHCSRLHILIWGIEMLDSFDGTKLTHELWFSIFLILGAALSSTPSSLTRISFSTTVSFGRHAVGCSCPNCASRAHPTGCACAGCNTKCHRGCSCSLCATRFGTALFADVVEEAEPEVPPEIEAMDGIESSQEAHNAERPARQRLQKKRPVAKGKELSEYEAGSMVNGKVKSITAYGAFIDIGAQTDGLLHISQLAAGFVSDVNDILKEGQDVEVRIVSIDEAKNQVALSLLTEEEAAAGQQAARQQRERPQKQSNRRDNSATLSTLTEKGWDVAAFVEGKVVSTVDFGCFVELDTSLLNSECEGKIDGLVHISALSTSRVSSVTDIVNVEDKVQVRVKSITGNKVSLTMLSVAEEETKDEARGGGGGPAFEGAKDWQELTIKVQSEAPVFSNRPLVVDMR